MGQSHSGEKAVSASEKDSPLLSIPVEIVTRIFESCDDFPQAVSLASACKHTNTAWVSNKPTIIWNVAKSQIRSFDDALMAVRTTAIVLEAYKAGNLPPAVAKLNSLSEKSKLLDLAELKEVFNMQHLVLCIEYMYFNSRLIHAGEIEDNLFLHLKYGRYPPEQRRFPEWLKEDIPGAENATIESFRDGFYRAMYRLLLAGAVLARTYMAPLFWAREEGGKLDSLRILRLSIGEYIIGQSLMFPTQLLSGKRTLPTFVNPRCITMTSQTGARSDSGETESMRLALDHSLPGLSKMEE